MVSGLRGKRRRRIVAAAAAAAVAGALLAACGGGSDGRDTLVWYINPDPAPPADFQGAFGQAGIAERCSTDRYRIETQQLPGDSTQQRIQLARRLAADDTGIDLMSLDVPFAGEFADAGFLAEIPDDVASRLQEQGLEGAVNGATYDGRLVAAPLWSNIQLLWYRKSFADKTGVDPRQGITWAELIDSAEEGGGTVGVQANKYEGYVVWINALVMGAGGEIVTDLDQGTEASIDIDSDAGRAAASVIEKLASSSAAESDLSVSNEGTVLGPFAGDSGAYQVNWTFIYNQYKSDEQVFDDLGWAPYPQTVDGQPSRPPLGGINIGVNSSSGHIDEALEAMECITSVDNQVTYAIETGNMPSSGAAYDAAELAKAYPADLLEMFRSSIDVAGPRPITPYWSDISTALQSTWHPADSVTEATPGRSAEFLREVLDGKRLL